MAIFMQMNIILCLKVPIWVFRKHTKFPMFALLLTLYSHNIFAISLFATYDIRKYEIRYQWM